MSAPSPSQNWPRIPFSSLVDVLVEDDEIEDVVALSGGEIPEWLRRLSIPMTWELIELPDAPDHVTMRRAVCGPRGNGQWDAAETINVFGYTGWPVFYDVLHNADRMLRSLRATGIATKVLPIPPLQWTAAVRSSGIALVDDRSVWLQQSNYVVGSEQAHAGRLIVQTLFVDTPYRDRLAQDVNQLSSDLYQGFVNAVSDEHAGC
jgi:hypothetical protein